MSEMELTTTTGQDISRANASAVVSENPCPTKRSLLVRDAVYEDQESHCLYWLVSSFDPDRAADVDASKGQIAVYIRPPPKGNRDELPEEGAVVQLLDMKRYSKKSRVPIAFTIDKRFYETNLSNNRNARKTECALITPTS
jgi:hypothetical protein